MLSDSEIMVQVLAAFREEQAEHRQAAGELLLELERNPDHPQRQALLDQLFREAHSLKGGARAASRAACIPQRPRRYPRRNPGSCPIPIRRSPALATRPGL